MPNVFEDIPKGILVSMEEESFSGYNYLIWFPYARNYMKKVREGNFIAIKNFGSSPSQHKYSILEITSVLPQHYALGSSASDAEKAFPGFYIEAAKSCRQDWEQEEPLEQTTIIKTQALPTGLQFTYNESEFTIEEEESTPMVGEEAFMISELYTNKIINRGLDPNSIPIISPGTLSLNKNININLATEDFLRMHFGIFGFTGSGKSNLASTIIHRLLTQDSFNLKIFITDLMSEYPPLLIDLFDEIDESYIIVFGEDSLPGGDVTRAYLSGDKEKEEEAINAIIRTMLLPKELARYRDSFKDKIRHILNTKKIRIYDEGKTLSTSRIRDALNSCVTGNLGNSRQPIISWIDANFKEDLDSEMTESYIERTIQSIQNLLDSGKIPESFESTDDESPSALDLYLPKDENKPRIRSSAKKVDISSGGRMVLIGMRSLLKNILGEGGEDIHQDLLIGFQDLLDLASSKKRSMVIFQCNRDDELRSETSSIFNGIFNIRRAIGITDPPILFFYDEADEFMPGSTSATSSYSQSLRCIRNIARRGRKFGMGLGIATQRVAYLDTSTLAQPHTYFISKMPRKYDRDTMADSFGVTEDMMKKTLKFTKGQWLLISYDATGLINVPIPVQLPNANLRIIKYLSGK